ncbi:MAG: hypothetical protein IPJ88_15480 [Myxococcales bacterium]|nr:MAG: hypothetical protein IPJ88_15480 [Myxococcales bacterium]
MAWQMNYDDTRFVSLAALRSNSGQTHVFGATGDEQNTQLIGFAPDGTLHWVASDASDLNELESSLMSPDELDLPMAQVCRECVQEFRTYQFITMLVAFAAIIIGLVVVRRAGGWQGKAVGLGIVALAIATFVSSMRAWIVAGNPEKSNASIDIPRIETSVGDDGWLIQWFGQAGQLLVDLLSGVTNAFIGAINLFDRLYWSAWDGYGGYPVCTDACQ